MFVLHVFEGLFAIAVSPIYFKCGKPIRSIKCLFQEFSKGLFSHSIRDIAVAANKQDPQDFIYIKKTLIFILHSLFIYTCSVEEVLSFPQTQIRVNLTIFLVTSRKDKVLCLLKIANTDSIWFLS